MNRILHVFALWALVVPGYALTINGMPPPLNARQPAPIAQSAAKATADDSSGLRKGTVEAVSAGAGTFHVYGQRLTFDAKRVRVFGRDGNPSSIYALKTGANVRFTLDASDPTHRRVAVIYID